MLFKKKDVVKDESIRIRLTKAEKEELKTLAANENLPVAEYVLRLAKKRKGGSRTPNVDLLLEVRRLGVLLKELHRLDGQDRDLYRNALIEVAEVLRTVPLKVIDNS